MSETALWLVYVLGGLVAFLAVHRGGWRIVPSMLSGAAVSLIIWMVSLLLVSEDKRPAFFEVDLSLNATFSLIFAGAGAAIGYWMRARRAL